jgi:hypothetical protein
MPFDLVAPDLQGVPTTIERLDPSEAVKVVGVHQSLDGKMTTQVAALKAKADSWGEKSNMAGYHGTWPTKGGTT